MLNLSRDDTIEAILDFPELAIEMLRTLGLRFASRMLEVEATNARLRDRLRAAGLPDDGAGPADPAT